MNERNARKLVYARSNNVCERCGRRRASEAHHRKNRSQGGQWTPANLLHLCTLCHRDVTISPRIAYEQGWAVPSYADPIATPVWLAGWGFVLLTDVGTIELEAA